MMSATALSVPEHIFTDLCIISVAQAWRDDGEVLATGIKCCPLTGQDIPEDPCGRFEMVTPGTVSPQEYDRTVADLPDFLAGMAESVALVRYQMGVYVIFLPAVLPVFSWALKRESREEIY